MTGILSRSEVGVVEGVQVLEYQLSGMTLQQREALQALDRLSLDFQPHVRDLPAALQKKVVQCEKITTETVKAVKGLWTQLLDFYKKFVVEEEKQISDFIQTELIEAAYSQGNVAESIVLDGKQVEVDEQLIRQIEEITQEGTEQIIRVSLIHIQESAGLFAYLTQGVRAALSAQKEAPFQGCELSITSMALSILCDKKKLEEKIRKRSPFKDSIEKLKQAFEAKQRQKIAQCKAIEEGETSLEDDSLTIVSSLSGMSTDGDSLCSSPELVNRLLNEEEKEGCKMELYRLLVEAFECTCEGAHPNPNLLQEMVRNIESKLSHLSLDPLEQQYVKEVKDSVERLLQASSPEATRASSTTTQLGEISWEEVSQCPPEMASSLGKDWEKGLVKLALKLEIRALLFEAQAFLPGGHSPDPERLQDAVGEIKLKLFPLAKDGLEKEYVQEVEDILRRLCPQRRVHRIERVSFVEIALSEEPLEQSLVKLAWKLEINALLFEVKQLLSREGAVDEQELRDMIWTIRLKLFPFATDVSEKEYVQEVQAFLKQCNHKR